MGPIALFVVLVILPFAALLLVLAAMVLSGLAAALLSVPAISWLSFAGGVALGGAVLAIRRRRGRNVTIVA
jgi:hypothetical protein